MKRSTKSALMAVGFAGVALATESMGGSEVTTWILMGLATIVLLVFLPLGEWVDEQKSST